VSSSFDLRDFESYDEAVRRFQWDLPAAYNIAVDVCDRYADTGAVAARRVTRGRTDSATFAELADASSRLASSLAAMGLGRGDRVATILPSRIEALVAFLAVAKLGAVAVTLRWHDSQDLYRHELGIARPDAVIYDVSLAELLEPFRNGTLFLGTTGDTWPQFQQREAAAGSDVGRLLLDGDPSFLPVEVSVDHPLLVSFTSGSTGLSKGVVHAHRLGRGQRPAFQMATDLGPRADDVFFTPLGWATMVGLRAIVLPAWQFGRPVVVCGVDGPSIEEQCEVLTGEGATVAYLMPAALKAIRQLGPRAGDYDWSALRVIISAGEGIGGQLYDWVERELGAALHPYYGQTELAVVMSTCRRWFPAKPGSVGRLVPGHSLALDSDAETEGNRAAEQLGPIVVPVDDPGLFLGYLREGDESLPTGLTHPYDTADVVRIDDEGDFFYVGREDDVIQLPGGRVVAAAELEDAPSGVAGVLDASAVQVPAADGRPILVLCILIDQERSGALDRVLDEVRRRLVARLPSDALPEELAATTSFPRTRLTNKVNRKALRDSLAGAAADGSLLREPFGEIGALEQV
jgi:acetyl-CoA synthetase